MSYAPAFEALRDAHVAALTGSLIDGVARGPNGAGYVWSRTIPDPAFLARDAGERALLEALFEPAATYPASWMAARTAGAPALEAGIAVHAGPAPPAGFESVFAGLSEDPAVRAHLRRHYLPALRAARSRPGFVPVHLVLCDESGPAACASLVLHGDGAGLYNVGTRADRQGRGLGARITRAALSEARGRGAAEVFLQCPAGGPVEALYARAGFRTVCMPFLLCTARP